jgi:hypothetical protein
VANTFNELEQADGITGRLAVFIGYPEIGGVAITPTVGSAGTTVPGLTGSGFEPLCDALPVYSGVLTNQRAAAAAAPAEQGAALC